MDTGIMYFIWKHFICCVLLVLLEDLSVSEGGPWCCFNVLTNGSANYTLNTTGCRDNIWNRGNTSIKDENGDKDDTVIDFGPNSILLKKSDSGVNYMCTGSDNEIHSPVQCTDPCESVKADLQTEVSGLSTTLKVLIGGCVLAIIITITIIIIIIIIIIMWKKEWRCRGDAANRHEANNANHANGGFQAVNQGISCVI